MNSMPRRDPSHDETPRDRDSGQDRKIPRDAGASGERPESSDDIGIPTGYPERSFESKRFPIARQPQAKPNRSGRKPA